jgi:hypothetical protein
MVEATSAKFHIFEKLYFSFAFEVQFGRIQPFKLMGLSFFDILNISLHSLFARIIC